jgi:hypothetical protein
MKFRNVLNLFMAVCVAAALLVTAGCQKKAEETTPAAVSNTAPTTSTKEGAGPANSATMTPGPGVAGAENIAGSKAGK